MKTGLVMEGGAMRGMFTCGVQDVFMEEGITFDGAIGVSAGAAFGCNIKSHQIGRPIRYNKTYCRDKRYCSFHSLLKTGDLYGAEFCYHTLPYELDLFDMDTFEKDPMEFYVTCTDADTGKAVYHKCSDGRENDIQWMRASASMPLVSRIVELGGFRLLDGGVGDSIPVRYFQKKGFEKNVVILTQPLGYRKQKNKLLPLIRIAMRKYPNMIRAMANRHIRYNKTLDYIAEQEAAGKLLVIRPPKALEIGSTCKDVDELERVYQIGVATARENLEAVKAFLQS